MKTTTAVLSIAAIPFLSAILSTSLDPTGANQDQTNRSSFVEAAKRGDENAVRRALDEDSTLVHATDMLGMSALDWSATRKHWHIFRQLLDKGAPVSGIGFDGGTVMHRVAHHDRADMLRLLVAAGGDITTQNQWGRAPLHVAARRGCPDVARLLIDLGADLSAVTNEGWTPLHVAYRAGHPNLVELLLAAGADPGLEDGDGLLPAQHSFVRPAEVPMDDSALYDYQGLYDLDERVHFKVWVEGDVLMLQEHAPDELYATGRDTFYCRQEPWSVHFSRDEDGTVSEVDVQFLRRTVTGSKREHPLYVGSQACRSCHIRAELGNQYIPWVSSRHGAAYWRLATEWSMIIALSRPHFQDMENPREDNRCLICHVTGAQDPNALYAGSFSESEGIGCESCHGPGSLYMDAATMSNHEAFLAAGGRTPDESTCRSCHRNPDRFEFHEWWPRVAHGASGR